METELRDRVRDLRLGDHIRFLGWLEANQLQHILWSSSVFLHVVPEHDPFPVAVLEAMASGLPVISTRLAGSAVDRVEEGVTGFFVDPERPSELEHAMARFAQDRPLAISMGQKARIRAEEWPVERGVATIRELFQLLS
ncbi:MAG: glycosyltransferase family 4 protein [Deltaproteobacteria bacterium]|nr:glycosyltransferase family 4 protein [Deltaproteobacteria bacterium]